jgi:hypothetical protein
MTLLQGDNPPIRVQIAVTEIEEADEGVLRDATSRGITDAIRERVTTLDDAAMDSAFDLAFRVARKAQRLMERLEATPSTENANHKLSGGEVEFGLSFSAEGSPFLTLGVEATLAIKLTWERKA